MKKKELSRPLLQPIHISLGILFRYNLYPVGIFFSRELIKSTDQFDVRLNMEGDIYISQLIFYTKGMTTSDVLLFRHKTRCRRSRQFTYQCTHNIPSSLNPDFVAFFLPCFPETFSDSSLQQR